MSNKTLNEIYNAPYGVELVGPNTCGRYRIVVQGYRVPYMVAYRRSDTDTDWSILLDERFEFDLNDDELRRCMSLVANAMAIAAGYTAFGENAHPRNPFSTRVMFLTDIPDDAEAAP